ncbi:aminopeptidase Ey-like isoform X2 [Photinus pyralis]|uniref:aminopeptidase Ey-like isoform X2 n=1 Tax=Photinus pyralis TaxID=7054 RepID=UPI001266EDEF|nr:aminopeptidase Ey-like isoform X2 [Photinus pyralis]
MSYLKVLFPLLVLLNGVKTDGDNEKQKYRLNGNLIPSTYEVEVTVMDNFGSTAQFFGNVKIRFRAKLQTSEITLHSNKLKFDATHIQISHDPPQTPIAVSDVTFNSALEMVTIKTQSPISINSSYILSVNNYEGFLDLDMNGFYRSYYNNSKGESEWIAVTQFQPTSARRAFPCFDEPQYKAKFDVVINHPLDYYAVSNAEIKTIETSTKSKKTIFNSSPIMSTYLVAFAVTKYAAMTVSTNNIKHSIWSSMETIRDSQYALSVSPKLLKVMENFTKIPYSVSGLTKLDQFSIPDFSAGAMENWGMVTYRETAILWDPYENSRRNKQRVGTVVAHELSHMLFGNLVTTKWWSSTWLNEGFATFFEYFSLAQIENDWELDLQFIIEEHQRVLVSDSLEKAKPLTNPNVFTPGDISGMFGSISYSKGGSVIRMMSLFLGETTFFDGLNLYLTDLKFNSSEPEDLFKKIQEKVEVSNQLPTNLSAIMNSWTEKHGFPMITVNKSDSNLILTQSQFFSNTTPPTKWYIPVTYTTSVEKKFSDLKAKKWMLPTESETVINGVWTPQVSWVILNVGVSAFVRVNYDDALWTGLQHALHKENFDGITPINRAQIVDDAMNLARADVLTYERAFNIISFLQKDNDYYPWQSAFNAFVYLRRRIDKESALGKSLDKHIQRMMNTLYKSVDFNNNNKRHVEMLKKAMALTWACQLSVSDCTSQAQALFTDYMTKNKTIDPNLRSVVYCTAVRSTGKSENWEYLWKKLEQSQRASESVTIISALGCTQNTNLLHRYLNESIKENSTIRRQDGQSVFNSVISGSSKGVAIGLQFLIDHFESISTSYGGMNALTSVINGLADRLTTKEDVARLEEFISKNRDKLKDAATAADTAIETAKKNLEWVVKNEKELMQYLQNTDEGKGNDSNKVKSTFVLVFTFVGVALKRWL